MKKIFFYTLLLFCINVHAAPIGTILFALNKVTIERDGKGIPAKRGSSFFEGDIISTGAQSQAQLRYTNGTFIALQPNTSYRINSYTPEGKVQQSQATLMKGGLESSTQGQKKATLQTPVIALAISGTAYRVMLSGQGKATKVAAQVYKGQVQLGTFPLGPNEEYSSAEYDGLTGRIMPGPVFWTTWGWLPIAYIINVPQVSIASNTISEIIPSSVVNSTVTSTSTGQAVATISLLPPV